VRFKIDTAKVHQKIDYSRIFFLFELIKINQQDKAAILQYLGIQLFRKMFNQN